MSEPKLEGVERRLREQDEQIEVDSSKARRDTATAELPEQIEQVVTPPRVLIDTISGESVGLCGGRFQLEWQDGPWKGLPVTGYCVEPLCTVEGTCTGTRFVPHIEQFTSTNVDFRRKRKLDKREVVAAVRAFAHKAAEQTGRDEDRNDKEILALVKTVWLRTIASVRGQGGWSR